MNDKREILLNRNEFFGVSVTGTGAHSGGVQITPPARKSNSRKYVCPCCGNSVRATKEVHIACMDCQQTMIEY